MASQSYKIAEYSRCPVNQVLHQVAEDLDTNKKKTRGKPKLVPRFAAGTSNYIHSEILLIPGILFNTVKIDCNH